MKFFLSTFAWPLLLATPSPAASFSFVPQYSTTIIPTTTSLAATTTSSSRRNVLATTLATACATLLVPTTNAIETYLTEPTEEFKESERQRMEFRKKQLLSKGEFVKVLARLTGESSTEEDLVKDLIELRELVVKTGGLPLGIKKEDMYKVIRSKKAKGFWPTDVEIAYQGFKSEVRYQQSPNTEKDMENPL